MLNVYGVDVDCFYGYFKDQDNIVRSTINAYCLSELCTGKTDRQNAKGILKQVTKGTVFCVDCGDALLWQKSEKPYSRVIKFRGKYKRKSK